MASVAERRTIRADGPEKVTGSGRYAADLTLTGMLHAKLRYAGVAHGRITRLDTTRARSLPGVLAVITQADVPDVRYGPYIKDRTLFANDVVRYEGDIVAAVAALTPELAQAAVDAIEVEIEPLPVVDDVEAALADDSPLVHTDWESYESGDGVERSRNVAAFSSIEKGDVEAGMREADEIVKTRFVADASHAVPIEPRAIVAQWQGEKLTVWSSTQVPFDTRSGLAETLQLPESKVRVIVPHLGGGFGGKCGFHQEAHVAALARKADRPVRLLFTRREEFLVPDRRREGMVIELETGVKRDGTIVARRGRLVLDNGAYTADAAFFPQLAAMHVAGPYRIPHLRIDSQIVYTNTQPSGSVRAPTAPQACWALEQHIDEVARRIGIDGLELRRRNVIDTGDVGPSGQTFEQIGMRECLDRAAEMSGYETAELPDDEAIGIAVGWWPSFPGASGAYVKINADGSGVIVTGAQECGTGAVMALRQLAAQELGMEPEDFTILYQDTDAGPWDVGATGSQTTLNNGRAVLIAANEVGEQLRRLTADELEAAVEDIELVDGHARVVGSPDRQISIAALAEKAHEGELLLGRGSGPPGETPALRGSTCIGDLGMAAFAAPQFSSHAVHVRLDRDTGVVRVLAVAAAHDSGKILNVQGAEGQIEGGVLMGIGQALTEGTRYDAARQRNAMLLEYKLQTIMDAPPVRIAWVESPAPDGGPHGSKGLAEAPNVTTAAAIGNAIAKLIGHHVQQLPMTAERVWEAMAR